MVRIDPPFSVSMNERVCLSCEQPSTQLTSIDLCEECSTVWASDMEAIHTAVDTYVTRAQLHYVMRMVRA